LRCSSEPFFSHTCMSPPTHASCLANAPRWGRRLRCWHAALIMPPSHYLKLRPAVRCRSSPEFPFRFVWVLGWSTRYLCANDPTPCTCKTNYLRISMLFNIFLHLRRSFASSCHSGTCSSLHRKCPMRARARIIARCAEIHRRRPGVGWAAAPASADLEGPLPQIISRRIRDVGREQQSAHQTRRLPQHPQRA
jgi:hypothetical protein